MKRTIAAGLVIFLLLFMSTASASTAGTVADPLISLSYLEGAFSETLRADIAGMLGETAGRAMNRLDEIYGNNMGYDVTARFTRVSLSAGDTITLTMGGSFILLSGTATLTANSGTVINITTAIETPAGTQLIQDHRYFCAENTTAVISAGSASVGYVDGYGHYAADTTETTDTTDTVATNQEHPVFRDVMESDWFYSAVDYVYRNNLFGGTTQNTFSPTVSMTRGMFVSVLYRLEGQPEAGPGGQFTDVRNTSLYYYDAVTWANSSNVVLGYSDGTFGPNDPVTREQMATIIYRYAQYKQRDMAEPDSSYNAFTDRGDVSAYAVSAMRWTVSWGLISGTDGKLLPRNTATRAEVAQIISNYAQIIM